MLEILTRTPEIPVSPSPKKSVNSPRKRSRKRPPPAPLVYGDIDGSLVFMPLAHARDLGLLWKGLKQAETWGEFRAIVTPERFLELVNLEWEAGMMDDLIPEDDEDFDPDFDTFPPADTPFDGMGLGRVCDGYYPEWPAQEMLDWLPESILTAPFARRVSTMHNGSSLELDPAHEAEIVTFLEKEGHNVTRDDALVCWASGYSGCGD